jgi:hypothetical protein
LWPDGSKGIDPRPFSSVIALLLSPMLTAVTMQRRRCRRARLREANCEGALNEAFERTCTGSLFGEQLMPWQRITPENDVVLAHPTGLWTRIIGYLHGPATIKIEAKDGQWSYSESPTTQCGADGDPDSLLARTRCLLPTAPVGALVGKTGGSTAGVVNDGTLFVACKSCVVQFPKAELLFTSPLTTKVAGWPTTPVRSTCLCISGRKSFYGRPRQRYLA